MRLASVASSPCSWRVSWATPRNVDVINKEAARDEGKPNALDGMEWS